MVRCRPNRCELNEKENSLRCKWFLTVHFYSIKKYFTHQLQQNFIFYDNIFSFFFAVFSAKKKEEKLVWQNQSSVTNLIITVAFFAQKTLNLLRSRLIWFLSRFHCTLSFFIMYTNIYILNIVNTMRFCFF